MADAKEIAVKASVDIGDNITSLIEKLAAQIGTTTDKVFPWYVKQQIIEGWMWIAACGFSIALGFILLSVFWKKADFDDGNRYTAPTIGATILSIGGIVFLIFGMTGAVTQIANPNYYALKAMTADMARLLGH